MCGLCCNAVNVPNEGDPNELIECICGNAATSEFILDTVNGFITEVMAKQSLLETIGSEVDESVLLYRHIAYLRRHFLFFVKLPDGL